MCYSKKQSIFVGGDIYIYIYILLLIRFDPCYQCVRTIGNYGDDNDNDDNSDRMMIPNLVGENYSSYHFIPFVYRYQYRYRFYFLIHLITVHH
mmetsp:Transcript_11117/g.12263  ORF Transcript_11117/g.12263 Transcript_11117/m.12263 type:complete len:93 (+) Transcript_11117:109-387(+)